MPNKDYIVLRNGESQSFLLMNHSATKNTFPGKLSPFFFVFSLFRIAIAVFGHFSCHIGV